VADELTRCVTKTEIFAWTKLGSLLGLLMWSWRHGDMSKRRSIPAPHSCRCFGRVGDHVDAVMWRVVLEERRAESKLKSESEQSPQAAIETPLAGVAHELQGFHE
jgi:hypothetical protein